MTLINTISSNILLILALTPIIGIFIILGLPFAQGYTSKTLFGASLEGNRALGHGSTGVNGIKDKEIALIVSLITF
jgi:hypothetical protein